MRPRALSSDFLSTLAIVAAAGLATRARAVVAGQPDTFTDGSVQNWAGGDSLGNLAGGPAGASDRFLNVLTNAAGGTGSRLATFNGDTRWQGDYITAGITSIDADMENLGSSTLQMRLVFFGSNGTRWTSTNSIQLDPAGGWRHFSFPVSPGSLTLVFGSGTYAASLSSVNQIMLRHDGSTPSAGGETIVGKLGIDNVVALPTPGAAGLLTMAGLFAARRRR